MATYTQISHESLTRFLYMFDIGELAHFEPITAGIENSNYFVTLDNESEYVLTITEDLELSEVPFFNDLLQQLVNARLPVPEAQRTLDGMSSALLKGKPTWLFNRLPGTHQMAPIPSQCHAIGRALATIHDQSPKCRYRRENVYNHAWACAALKQVTSQLDPTNLRNLQSAVDLYQDLSSEQLPSGIIHGDLFRDNALFLGDELTGVIDFYHACDDFLVQDIAIALNDWCVEGKQFSQSHEAAVLEGYETVRQLEPLELELLRQFRAFAAMRFSLTRLLANSDEPERQAAAQLSLLQHFRA